MAFIRHVRFHTAEDNAYDSGEVGGFSNVSNGNEQSLPFRLCLQVFRRLSHSAILAALITASLVGWAVVLLCGWSLMSAVITAMTPPAAKPANDTTCGLCLCHWASYVPLRGLPKV